MIRAFVPWLKKEEKAVIVGDSSRLGKWNPELGLTLTPVTQFIYKLNITISDNEQWKLLIIDPENNITWEEGDNRIANPDSLIWFRGGRKANGIEVPLFSLRGVNDNGIGDFQTLELFLQKISLEKYKIIQLLPINDTGRDKNPYNIISGFALNPIYLSLDKLGVLEDVETAHSIADLTEQISYSPKVEWEEVFQIKWNYFEAIFKQDGDKTINSKPFQKFLEKESEWLFPYASYCYLSEKYETNEHSKWDNNVSCYSEKTFDELVKDPDSRYRIFLYIFLQYHAFSQLNDVKKLATSLGISLSYKIPTGIRKNSVDAWSNPQLTDLTLSKGIEPNAKDITGIKSDACPVNWNNAKEWWIKRLKLTNTFFDICSLESIKEYFRTWVIPADYATALKGTYVPYSAPLTEKNIKKSGFKFDKSRDTKPRLTKEYILQFLGEDFKRFSEFFKKDNENNYNFKQNMSRNCDLVNYFKDRKDDEEELKNKLIRLQDECLFISIGNTFIPRIAAQYTNGYSLLKEGQKSIFNTLYDNFYYKQNDEIWKKNGNDCLGLMISRTNLLFCAEDTENITTYMHQAMMKYGILPSLFGKAPDEYPYMSLATASTHPNSSVISILPIKDWMTTTEKEVENNDLSFEKEIYSEESEKKWNWRVYRNLAL